MKLITLPILLLVGGCALPTYNQDLGGVEWEPQPAWHYIGCHTVTANPAQDGEKTFFIFPFIPLQVGNTVLFKNVQNNKVIKSRSLTECKELENE